MAVSPGTHVIMIIAAVFATLCVVAGFSSVIAALSTTHWLDNGAGDDVFQMGAFSGCYKSFNATQMVCTQWRELVEDDSVPMYFSITFFILALLVYLACLLVMAMFTWSVVFDKEAPWVYPSMWSTGVVSNFMAVMISLKFIFKTVDDDPTMGYSFHLSWASILMVLVGLGTSVTLCIFTGDDDEDGSAAAANTTTRTSEATPGGANADSETGNPIREEVYTPSDGIQFKKLTYNEDV